jgi:electron transfer flavoprotein alpha subunit
LSLAGSTIGGEMVLVVAECRDGRLDAASLEALTAARLIDSQVSLLLMTGAGAPVPDEVLKTPVDEVLHVTHEALAVPTARVLAAAVESALAELAPTHVVWAHTYEARDYVPRLAARIGRPLVTDCIAIERRDSALVFTRPIFQGRLLADVAAEGPSPHLVTVQRGVFAADSTAPDARLAPVRALAVAIPDAARRVRAETAADDHGPAADLASARRIVAVGRGVKDEAQLAGIRTLAAALGAELAASRPVCDAGWLPMDRQVGSSGQTVAPDLYVAVGISGAIQHVVGMKGSKTVIAINKDPDAPIFEVADYGVVGDIAEIIPALTNALGAR